MSAVGIIAGVKMLTQVMIPAEYGSLALGMTIAALGQQLVTGPLGNASMRFFAPAHQNRSIRTYLSAVKQLTIKTSSLLMVLLIAAVVVVANSRYASLVPLLFASGIFTVVSGVIGIFDSMQNAARQRGTVAWHQAAFVWLRSLAAMYLVGVLGPTGANALFGYVAAAVLILISEYAFFRRQILPLGQQESDPAPTRCIVEMINMRNYATPFGKWGIFTWAQSMSDRWSLGLYSDKPAVGLYTLIFQLGYYPMSLLASTVSQLIAPIVFGKAGGTKHSARRLVYAAVVSFVILTLALCVISYCWSGLIFSLLVAPPYRAVASLLPWMILAAGIFSAGQLLSLNLLSEGDSAQLVRPKITTSILGILFNIFGAQMYGVAGVVVANIALSIVFCTWIAWLIKLAPAGERRI